MREYENRATENIIIVPVLKLTLRDFLFLFMFPREIFSQGQPMRDPQVATRITMSIQDHGKSCWYP